MFGFWVVCFDILCPDRLCRCYGGEVPGIRFPAASSASANSHASRRTITRQYTGSACQQIKETPTRDFTRDSYNEHGHGVAVNRITDYTLYPRAATQLNTDIKIALLRRDRLAK